MAEIETSIRTSAYPRARASRERGSRKTLGTPGFRISLLLVLLSFGCANLSFRAGATPDEIGRDEAACRDASGEDRDDYTRCMKERGYVVAGPEGGLEWEPRPR